jgi:tRNA-dihydrouridine synthase A
MRKSSFRWFAVLYLQFGASICAWSLGPETMFASAFLSHRSLVGRRSLVHRSRRRDLSVSYSSINNAKNGESGGKDDDPNRIVREAKYKELMGATTLSLAPMMEYTDRHFRHLVRLVSSQTLLYTEMVAANALAHERREQQLQATADGAATTSNYDDQYLRRYLQQGVIEPLEGPSVLQLGGSDPQQMMEAAQTVMDLTARGHCDYTAINLNCGCPSPKVAGKGCFGAALMDDPSLVAELTRALHEGSDGQLPITVKCRIGTDSDQAFQQKTYAEMDPEKEYQELCRFIETVASNGIVTDFSVHARIAVLQKSFSPADNRKIPPLKYDIVRRLVGDYPEFSFSLNGGVDSLLQVQAELEASPGLKGVMVGRAWAADPWSFAMADQLLYNKNPSTPKNRLQILEDYGRHADTEEEMWDPTKIRRFIVKAVHPLFAGEHNSKRYRIALDEIAGLPKKRAAEGKSLDGQPPLSEMILNCALQHLSEETLLRTPAESYERLLWEDKKRQSNGGRSESVMAWQSRRKEDERDATAADDAVVSDANIRASL